MIDCSQITMYSGGHRGAEAEFGKTAERWGIQEVNFSFEGHAVERDRGVRILDPDQLGKGDVSMEIVSLRMGRTYARTNKIRKVIQSIFHMVNKGYHVITIGWIQPDDTVKGGTGWGVELAKLFNDRALEFLIDINRQTFERLQKFAVFLSHNYLGPGYLQFITLPTHLLNQN